MAGTRQTWIRRDRDLDDAKSFHFDQSGKETMRAVEEFHMRDALPFEHSIGATGITDIFAGEFVAHPISDA